MPAAGLVDATALESTVRATAGAVAAALDTESTATALRRLLLLRQCPWVPFSLSNYFLGALTNHPPWIMPAGTLLGSLPSNFVAVAVGASGRELVGHRRSGAPTLARRVAAATLLSAGCATAFLGVQMTSFAKLTLQEAAAAAAAAVAEAAEAAVASGAGEAAVEAVVEVGVGAAAAAAGAALAG